MKNLVFLIAISITSISLGQDSYIREFIVSSAKVITSKTMDHSQDYLLSATDWENIKYDPVSIRYVVNFTDSVIKKYVNNETSASVQAKFTVDTLDMLYSDFGSTATVEFFVIKFNDNSNNDQVTTLCRLDGWDMDRSDINHNFRHFIEYTTDSSNVATITVINAYEY
jgi:hypothetical protein